YTFLSSPFANPTRLHPTPPRLFSPRSHSLTHQAGSLHLHVHFLHPTAKAR
ncbi:hypothetical protein CORC01_09114, partial [Colletotrichum orchidophilum]